MELGEQIQNNSIRKDYVIKTENKIQCAVDFEKKYMEIHV